MRKSLICALVAVVASMICLAASAQQGTKIPKNSKVFIAPMDGFETYLKAAIEKKKVPVVIVDHKSLADFEIVGTSESKKASTAKKIILWDWRSKEEASIQVIDLKSSEVVFAYSVHKASSAHGKQSSAEACAKHLNKKIEVE